jgi:hypothetical protein
VIFDISVSVDGFVNAKHPRSEEPMGDGGQQLHDWAGGGQGGADKRSRALLDAEREHAGAMICGPRTYDTSLPVGVPMGRAVPRASRSLRPTTSQVP